MNNKIYNYLSFWLGVGGLVVSYFLSKGSMQLVGNSICTSFLFTFAHLEMIADNQKDIWRKLNETKDK